MTPPRYAEIQLPKGEAVTTESAQLQGPEEPANDAVYEWADAIEDVMLTKPCEYWWTPSEVARRAQISTSEAHEALRWMERRAFVIGISNGAWRKYARKY